MNRRFNYTGRMRIERERVSIALARGTGGPGRFEAKLDLAGLGLPDDSQVFVEAYRQAVIQRFPFGSLASPRASTDTDLTEFGDPGGVLFRVKVVGVGERHGHLLAEADRVTPKEAGTEEGRRRSLLPVAAEDLRGEVWRLEFENGDPVLLIERTLGDPVTISRDPGFASLVFPAVIQLILRQLVSSGDYDPDEPSGWQADWLQFAGDVAPAFTPPQAGDAEGASEWIRSVSREFSQRHALVARLAERWEREAR